MITRTGGAIRRLEPGATVVIVDNNYVEGSNHRITRTDEKGNTYQRRCLADGREWEVRKNFPTPRRWRPGWPCTAQLRRSPR